MKRIRFEFPNALGDSLAGLLEMPESEQYSAMALFAHCFTCGKDSAAASRIAGRLVDQGIAVLRFDFTGLGSSDGEFANSNFSSNIEDIACGDLFMALDESWYMTGARICIDGGFEIDGSLPDAEYWTE